MSLRRGVAVAEHPLTLSESERRDELGATVAHFLSTLRHLGVDAMAVREAIDRRLRPARIAEQTT